MSDLPILIAGGGIGGLCTAIGLQASGQRVLVLERNAQLREVGAGLTLFPNGLERWTVSGSALRSGRWACPWVTGVFVLVMADGCFASRRPG